MKRAGIIYTMTVFIIILLVLVTVSCSSTSAGTNSNSSNSPGTGTSTPTAGNTAVSFAGDIQPIFNANCVGCHRGNNASGGLNLESGKAYGNLVSKLSGESNLDYVAPGAPENSYLVHKLEGTQQQVGGGGSRMPLGGPALPDAQIATVREWITNGAPDN